MKVWIVRTYYWRDNEEVILGVFSSLKKAESYIQSLQPNKDVDGYNINCWTVDMLCKGD